MDTGAAELLATCHAEVLSAWMFYTSNLEFGMIPPGFPISIEVYQLCIHDYAFNNI